MVHIAVADKSGPFDLIYVEKEKGETCNCDFNNLLPSWLVNLGSSNHICINCGRRIDANRLDDYNKYFGFHGYDEVEECNG